MSKISPLDPALHSKLRVNEGDYSHVSTENVVPVIAHEIAAIGSDLPIVFIKNTETGQFNCVAVLGLESKENLMVKDGKWLGTQIPGSIGTFPFKLAQMDEEGQYAMAIVEDSAVVSETEGQLLFNEDGSDSEYLQNRKKAIQQYFELSVMTPAFIQELVNADLLIQQKLSMDVNGQAINLSGIYLVDEKKLSSMPDEDFLALRTKGLLPLIYAHLGSMHQMRKLAALKMQKTQ